MRHPPFLHHCVVALGLCGALCVSAIAAEWGPEIGVVAGQGAERGRLGVWAQTNAATRYWFRTPAGATELNVLAVGADDSVDLIVRRGSPTAAPTCFREGADIRHRVCTIELTGEQSNAAVWYIEMPPAAAQHVAAH